VNLHHQINAELERQYSILSDAVLISPATLAHGAFERFSTGEEDAHIQYACLEHMKHMARVFLAKRKDAEAEMSEAYSRQGELALEFSGKLQDRYPLPRKEGDEPVYKLRSELTAEERAWNVAALRKSARARLEHADALEAEGLISEAA
jgi:hypothetical protein